MSLWFKGDRKPPWVIGLQPASGNLDISGLTTADFTFIFIDTAKPDTEIVGTGTFSALTAASGSNPASITYAPSASDVATVRTHTRRIVLKRATNDQQTFEIDDQSIEQ
jgi:hypothetical protein